MAQARTLVGLDVHASKIVAATLDAQTGELQSLRLGGCPTSADEIGPRSFLDGGPHDETRSRGHPNPRISV